jgi:hypothetical protein
LSEKTINGVFNNIHGFLQEVLNDLENGSGGKSKKNQDEDEEDKDEEEADEGRTWDDVTKLNEVLGQIFKKHPKASKGPIKFGLTVIIPRIYKQEEGKIPALYLLDDIIESADFNEISQQIPNLVKILVESSKSSDDGIRQAAVFGLGVFAKHSGNHFKDHCLSVLGALKVAIELTGDSDKNFDYARDNAIAGLGRVLKHQYDILGEIGPQIGSYWVDQLPLKRDRIEGKEQHELLLDIILTKNASMVFGPNGEKMKKVLEIFGTIIGGKLSTPDVDAKIEQVLKGLIANENMSSILVKAGQELDEKKKLALAKFFTKDE